jgi:hypothetical protein
MSMSGRDAVEHRLAEGVKMRSVHRFVAVFAVLFGFYIGCTGTLLQMVDLRTLFSHAPATDPNMQAIREGFSGPPNFRVILDSDYSAAPLPADFDFDSALATVVDRSGSSIPWTDFCALMR